MILAALREHPEDTRELAAICLRHRGAFVGTGAWPPASAAGTLASEPKGLGDTPEEEASGEGFGRAQAQYRSVQGVPDDDPLHEVVDNITDRLFEVEMKLLDAIAATKAQTLRGMAVKAWVLARALECEHRDQAAIEEALKGSDELSKSAAFSLVLDILRLAA